MFFSMLTLVLSPLTKDNDNLKLKFYKLLFFIGFFAFILTPFLLSGFEIGSLLGSKGASVNARTMEVWPQSMSRLWHLPTFLIGDGMGSVGDAARYTSLSLAIPPDNLFLFVSIQTGFIISIILFSWIFYMAMNSTPGIKPLTPAYAILAFLLLNGITANILAGIVASFYFGYAVGCINYFGSPEPGVPRKYSFLTK